MSALPTLPDSAEQAYIDQAIAKNNGRPGALLGILEAVQEHHPHKYLSLEALRYVHWLKPTGKLVYNIVQVNPSTVSSGAAEYPAGIQERIADAFPHSLGLNAVAIAEQAGTARAANLVLLGAIFHDLPFSAEVWDAVLKRELKPNILEVNLRAYHMGKAAAEG